MEQEHKPLFMNPNDTPEESVDKERCQVTNCGKRQWRPLLTTNALADIAPLLISSLFFLSGKPKSLPRRHRVKFVGCAHFAVTCV